MVFGANTVVFGANTVVFRADTVAPLGQFSHRVAMSGCVSVCLRHPVQFFSRPPIGPEVI